MRIGLLVHFLEVGEAFDGVGGVGFAGAVVGPAVGAGAVVGDDAEGYDGVEAFELVDYVGSMGPGAAEVEV